MCVHSGGHQYYIVLRIHSSTLIPVLEIYTALGGYRSEADGSPSPPTPHPSIVTCRFEWQPSAAKSIPATVRMVDVCCVRCVSIAGGNGRKMLIVGGLFASIAKVGYSEKRGAKLEDETCKLC